jgi:hypothetical protein
MDDDKADMNAALMVDGNAVAGRLQFIFGREMTTALARCAGCANAAEVGALIAFTRGPGTVLRCPACQASIVRIVETPDAVYFDARGATYVRMESRP